MQITSSRIWTRVADSISNDDKRSAYAYIQKLTLIQPLRHEQDLTQGQF